MEIRVMPVRLAIVLSVGFFIAADAHSQQVYRWVDKKGVVHFTDDPERLPEPQRSEALRKLKVHTGTKRSEQSTPSRESYPNPGHYKVPRKKRTKAPVSTKEASSQPKKPRSNLPGRSSGRISKGKSAQADESDSVESLRNRCKQIEKQRDLARRRALIFARPIDRQQAERYQQQLQECMKKLEEARQRGR